MKEQLDSFFSQHPPQVNWENSLALGQWAYYTSAKGDPAEKEKIKQAYIAAADHILTLINQDRYRNSLAADEHVWASAKSMAAKGNLLLMANEMSPNKEYVNGALDQLHNVLGRSATGYSYVTGIGSKSPQNPHHRIHASTGVLIPGLLVGGPNSSGGDPEIDKIKSQVPPAKSYLDVQESYSSNEYAIDYNAPLVLLLSYFDR